MIRRTARADRRVPIPQRTMADLLRWHHRATHGVRYRGSCVDAIRRQVAYDRGRVAHDFEASHRVSRAFADQEDRQQARLRIRRRLEWRQGLRPRNRSQPETVTSA